MSEPVSFEVLRERFPSEILNPWGHVLVIPNRLFQRGWELELEARGHRVFCGSHNGESCFFVRVDAGEPRKIETRHARSNNVVTTKAPSPSRAKFDKYRRWGSEEVKRLKKMLEQRIDTGRISSSESAV